MAEAPCPFLSHTRMGGADDLSRTTSGVTDRSPAGSWHRKALETMVSQTNALFELLGPAAGVLNRFGQSK